MPIKGLTDRGLALPEIGQIRKGAKKEPNKPGADLAYFRVEFDEQEKTAAANFKEVYKEQYEKFGGPPYIRIILPFNEIERMWDAWKEAYTAGRLVARSDGEFIAYQLDKDGEIVVKNWLDKSGNKVPYPQDGIAGQDYQNKPVKFKNTARLKVIVPELSRAAYLTVITSSTHDIGNISDQLAAFKELNNGQLAGIPFILRRRPKMISTPGENGQRVRRKKSLISIEADPEWVKAKLGALQIAALPDFEQALLPSGEIGDNEPIDFDEEEFADFEQDIQDPGEAEPVELIKPLSDWAVSEAAKAWNISKDKAAKEIAKRDLGKQIDKRDFLSIIHGEK